MKSPFVSVGVTAVLAAGLMLSPGLSPASASTGETTVAGTSSSSESLGKAALGDTATTYGMWFLPCSMAGLRWC